MVLRLRQPPPDNWRNAKCLGLVKGPYGGPEWDCPWFEDHPTALDFCNGTADGIVCPIRQECLTFALVNNQKDGVWGGMSEVARKGLRRQWPPNKGEAAKEAREEWVWMTEEEALGGADPADLTEDDDDE